MIFAGAFDCFGVKRSQLMAVYSQIVDRVSSDRKKEATGQFSMFGSILKEEDNKDVTYPNIQEYDNQTKLKMEKEVVGVYVSGHPLSNHIDRFADYNLTSDMLTVEEEEVMNVDDNQEEKVQEYDGLQDGMEITCGGIVTEVKKLLTKNGNKEMAFAKIEDLYGTIDLMFFPNVYARVKPDLAVDALVTIKGKLSIRAGEAPTVLVDNIIPWTNVKETEQLVTKKPKTLYLKYDLTNIELHDKIYALLKSYPGTIPVIVKCSVENKSYKLNLLVDGNDFLLKELLAYVREEFIKLL